ncbi:hypothetical protein JSY36_04615 [Bacillus sp. H-16]|uniref:hypothetical protein n=1 Tax=Alteribacter salitolerans TaxID=2912333 RepID=UPI0019625F5B|nr:hypothetical protein [Alteribacter salitolerans]MBM7095034.1 hypothetical protein [Alteribacter salitolerans]
MKIMAKTLTAGILTAALVACGSTDEEEDTASGSGGSESPDTEESAGDDEGQNESDEESGEQEEAAASESEITLIAAGDDQIAYDINGSESVIDAEVHETAFGAKLKLPEGLELEDLEGGAPTAQVLVDDEDHDLYGLTMTLTETTILDAEGNPMERAIDLDRELDMEKRMVGNRGHVENYESFYMQAGAEFDFYIRSEGDASKPGSWSEAIRGNDYVNYEFFKITDTGKYTVSVMFPEESADEDFEAKATAIATTFEAPEETDGEEEEEAETEEDQE